MQSFALFHRRQTTGVNAEARFDVDRASGFAGRSRLVTDFVKVCAIAGRGSARDWNKSQSDDRGEIR
jgi:hypothetical protein